MSGKQYLEVGNVIAVTGLSIGLNLFLIPRWGITGAALAMLSSQAGILLIRLIEVRHVLELRLYTSSYLKPVFALLPASILGIVLHIFFGSGHSAPLGSNVAMMFMVFTVTALGYFAFLYCLGLEEEDLSLWRQVRIT
jgi:O-antigen/teichoic acid export membrane protein